MERNLVVERQNFDRFQDFSERAHGVTIVKGMATVNREKFNCFPMERAALDWRLSAARAERRAPPSADVMTRVELERAVAGYPKFVVWSEEDQVFVGRCPALFFGGVHGMDEGKVYEELCDVVGEWIELGDTRA
jgi:hypothetical protein